MSLGAAMASVLKAICDVTGTMTVGMALMKGIVVCGIKYLWKSFLFLILHLMILDQLRNLLIV